MVQKIHVMHYLNQYFAGIGGEDKADIPPDFSKVPLGPGKRLQTLLKDGAEIVVTAYCGDNYFNEHRDEALSVISEVAKEHNVDIVVAGPAFVAGRYGFACIEVCRYLSVTYGLYGVTGIHIESPALNTYKQYKDRKVFAFPTQGDVVGMEDALSKMSQFVSKLAANSSVGSASEEGYIARDIRIAESMAETGIERAIDMLLDKCAGRSFTTEIPTQMVLRQLLVPTCLQFLNFGLLSH